MICQIFFKLEQELSHLSSEATVIMVIDHAGRVVFVFGNNRPLDSLYSLDNLVSDVCWVRPLADEDMPEFLIDTKNDYE